MTIPVEEVRDIKTAFDIFDGDLSGVVDPQELKRAFEQLGFQGDNKFVYQILAELDDDQSGGIEFPEFLRLATAKMSDKDSRAEIDKVWSSFDVNKAVHISLFREKLPLWNWKRLPRNWERTFLRKTSTICSSKLTLMMMDLLLEMISTTSWPTRLTGTNENDPLCTIIILFLLLYSVTWQKPKNQMKLLEWYQSQEIILQTSQFTSILIIENEYRKLFEMVLFQPRENLLRENSRRNSRELYGQYSQAKI